MNRVKIKDLLGVKISKNMSAADVMDNLTIAMDHVKDEDPELYDTLNQFVEPIKALVVLNQEIQDKAIKIAELQEKVEEGQKALNTAMVKNDQKNQNVVSIIGKAAGSQPPYPTVDLETKPTIELVVSSKNALDELKSKLDDGLEKLSDLSAKFKEDFESELDSLSAAITKGRGIEFDPSQSNHIYV